MAPQSATRRTPQRRCHFLATTIEISHLLVVSSSSSFIFSFRSTWRPKRCRTTHSAPPLPCPDPPQPEVRDVTQRRSPGRDRPLPRSPASQFAMIWDIGNARARPSLQPPSPRGSGADLATAVRGRCMGRQWGFRAPLTWRHRATERASPSLALTLALDGGGRGRICSEIRNLGRKQKRRRRVARRGTHVR